MTGTTEGTGRRNGEPSTPMPPLLTELATRTVDPGYAEAAARRNGADQRHVAWRALGVVALVIGVLVAVAAQQARGREPEGARTRAALAAEVRRRSTAVSKLAAEVVAAQAALATAQETELTGSREGAALAVRLSALEVAVGVEPRSGPALVVELSDAPADDAATDPDSTETEEEGRIRDADLQQIVNVLWSAGAEAIAVNGQRVTALTAIRQAGRAILVDYRPVGSPYTVVAIGNVDTIEPAFADSTTARRFHTFSEVYGLGYSTRRVRRADVPAGALTTLGRARQVGPR